MALLSGLESRLQARIARVLNAEAGVVCLVYHGSPYGRRGHSDLYGVAKGRGFFLEVKRPDGAGATKIQEAFLARVREAGAISGVVRSPEEARVLLGLL